MSRHFFAKNAPLLPHLLCAGAALFSQELMAANSTWLGAASGNFAVAANWSALPADDLVTDTGVFTSGGTANEPQLSASRSVGGLLFSAAAGGRTLGSDSAAYVLTVGGGGISTAGQTSGTNTLNANLGIGATQTWQVGAGGTLLVKGSVLAGSSTASTLAGQLVDGAGSNTGTLVLDPAAGNAVSLYTTIASAAALQINQVLQLGSALNSTGSTNVIYNASSAGIRLASTGVLNVLAGTWKTNDLGSNNSSAFTGTLNLSGGTLLTGGARYLGQINGSVGTTINVTGGSLIVTGGGNTVINSGFLGLGNFGAGTPTGTVTMNVSGGLVDVAKANGTMPAGATTAGLALGGVSNTTALFNQSGGLVRVGVTTGSHALTGATNTNTFNNLSIGSTVAGNSTAFTLSGGTLLVAGTIQGAASPGAVSNFNLLGGTLAAGGVNVTNLSYSNTATASTNQTANATGLGSLVNRGATIAPGDIGTAGKTIVTGNLVLTSGALSVDLGGTTQATGFQTGQYDFLTVSGTTTLGGNLAVNILPGFTPAASQTFTILSSTGAISGAFANAASGQRIVSADGLSTFVVSQTANAVTLGQYLPVTAPTISSSSSPSQISAGDSVVLGITADSLAPVTYVWTKDGVVIAGATSSALTFININAADAGSYKVTATNSAGSVSQTFPVVITVPVSTVGTVIDAGGSQTFTATAGATSYRWILDGDDVSTASSYIYTPTTKAVGTHWLRVVETRTGSAAVTRNWAIRVRIPMPASALTYYVAPGGSDSAGGTAGAPFATLEKARDTIRALSHPLPAGGVTVFLRGGTYRRTATFSLTATDSGTPTAPVIYAAYPGETPVLTGGRLMLASQFSPLAASEQSRVAPGVDPTRIWELDVTGNSRANTFPVVFNEWWIYNALRSSQNGGLLELFYNGARMPLSRYPNNNPADDTLTTSLAMNGVATGAASDGTGYLNGAGTYTASDGSSVAVGGAFHYNSADAAHVARWQTALTHGGLWLAGYWRVPWQINGVKIGLIDSGANQTIALATGASVSNGIGNKYNRPAGNHAEPFWAINLLEELDQPGEWCVDFNRKRIYIFTNSATAPADGAVELSDLSTPLVQINGGSDIYLQGLSFRRQLGHAVQILGGARDLVLGCSFSQNGNFAVDINGGTAHGVVSCNLDDLSSGGVILRGGTETPSITNSNQFAVNNKVTGFGKVVRVYQVAIDSGYGGPLGSSKQVSVGTRVAHNTATGSPHGAILWGSYNQVFEYNDLSDFCRISEDLGGIYRFGPNYQSASVIRYNYAHHSRLGDGIYNDFDHLNVAVYGNVTNLHTPSTSSRGYGFWTATNTAVGGAVPGISMALNLYNNIAVNSRSNYSLHSSTGGVIENNLSYRKLASDFLWYRITTDGSTATNSYAGSSAAVLASGVNQSYMSDPGFVDFANDDLRLRPDAQAYLDMPNFVPVPREMAGLYNDEYRADATIYTPFVVTGAASGAGGNTATFNGTLVYPQFDANATVRVYWGTADGGTDPAAWQNVTVLGQPGSGAVSVTPADLAPQTRYYFRFHAVNAAGELWAEQSNSTTTFPLTSVASGGTASTDSAGTSAGLGFDGNSATAWQTLAGVTIGYLQYQFASNAAVRVTRYAITSAANSPARDPRDWQLLGSYDGVSWVVLDTRAGQTFSARGETRTYGFVSSQAFKFYRLVVTANNGDAGGLQIAELQLFSPSLTPDTTGPVITTPGNLSVSTNSSSGALVTFDVSAVDAISGNATATANPASGSLFPLGTTTVNVSATDTAGNTSTASFTVTVSLPPVPAPWSIQQIHPYAGVAAGTVSVVSGSTTAFQIVGTGGSSSGGTTGDMWTGSNDSFTYLSQPWTGDGTFTARIASFSSTDASAKAGITFRETTNTGARYSATYFLRKGDAWAQHKTATNGSSTNVNFFSTSSAGKGIPYWIRLVRTGDVFTNYISPDGATWTQLGTAQSNPLSGAALTVGLAVAPRTGGTTATVTFDNITFLTPVQIWRKANFGTTANTGAASLTADPDGDGRVNALEYALGTSPNVANSQADLASEAIEGFLTLTFSRIADPAVIYSVEAASSLAPADWTEIWQSTGAANVAGPVTVSDTVDISTANPPRRFLRLRVTVP